MKKQVPEISCINCGKKFKDSVKLANHLCKVPEKNRFVRKGDMIYENYQGKTLPYISLKSSYIPKTLVLGAGKTQKTHSSFTFLDKVDTGHIDVIHDLEEPLPFGDGSFDAVIAEHVLEHIRNYIQLMEEIWRVLKLDGILKGIVPHVSNYEMWRDPTHVRGFQHGSFLYFTEGFDYNYYTKARFKIEKASLCFNRHLKLFEMLSNRYPRFYEMFLQNFVPCGSIKFELRRV